LDNGVIWHRIFSVHLVIFELIQISLFAIWRGKSTLPRLAGLDTYPP
jgi:hypothetical protein